MSISRRSLNKPLAGLSLAILLLTISFQFTPWYQRTNNSLMDSIQWMASEEHYHKNTLVIDVDDVALQQLRPYIGSWPYDRNLYAVVLDYLYEMGAKNVVFDILFIDPREGDDALMEAIERHPMTVLAGTQLGQASYSSVPPSQSLLSAIGWIAPDHTPAKRVQHLVLPSLLQDKQPTSPLNLGMVAAHPDDDGLLRRLPILFQTEDIYLTSLAMSALLARETERQFEFNRSGQHLSIDLSRWPVNPLGETAIDFPRNANSILSMSATAVFQQALGIPTNQALDEAAFEGKTIFIGSTSIQSDLVLTPRGIMGGTYFLAIAYESLKNGDILENSSTLLDNLLTLLGLISALIVLFRGDFKIIPDGLFTLACMISVFLISWWVMEFFKQPASPLTSWIVSFGIYLVFYIHQGLQARAENVKLAKLTEELNEANKKLEVFANTDSLTSLFNRRAFIESLDKEIKRNLRGGGNFCFAIMDLDHFKQVNDTYGHQVGDEALMVFSQILSNQCRSTDVAGRWGGEEFVVLLAETDLKGAVVFLERIRSITEATVIPSRPECKISVSIGVISYDGIEKNPGKLVSKADKALYQAKETGRNKICCA